jgi:hypothetical protein
LVPHSFSVLFLCSPILGRIISADGQDWRKNHIFRIFCKSAKKKERKKVPYRLHASSMLRSNAEWQNAEWQNAKVHNVKWQNIEWQNVKRQNVKWQNIEWQIFEKKLQMSNPSKPPSGVRCPPQV